MSAGSQQSVPSTGAAARDQAPLTVPGRTSVNLLAREALYLCAADITQTTIAAYGSDGLCRGHSPHHAFPEYANPWTLEHGLLEAAISDTSKTDVWRQCMAHYRLSFQSDLNRYVDRKAQWERHPDAVDIEVRSHQVPAITTDSTGKIINNHDGLPNQHDRTIDTLLKAISSGFGPATFTEQERRQNSKQYDALQGANLDKILTSFRKYDIVAISFDHPDHPNVAEKRIRTGGILFDLAHPDARFRVALAGFYDIPAPSQTPSYGESDGSTPGSIKGEKTSWIKATLEQRERYLPVHSKVYPEGSDRTSNAEPFKGKTSGLPIRGFTKGRMMKIGSIADMVHSLTMMTKTVDSVGARFMRKRSVPIECPAVPDRFFNAVYDYIFDENRRPEHIFKNLSIEHSIRPQFILDLCRYISGKPSVQWLWGMAGSGKTGYLVALSTCLMHFQQVAGEMLQARLHDMSGDLSEIPALLFEFANGYTLDITDLALAKIVALSDSNDATASLARRLWWNNVENGIRNALLTHCTTIDEVSDLTQDFNIYTKVYRIYQQFLPFDLGSSQRSLARLDDTIAENEGSLEEKIREKSAYERRKADGRAAGEEEPVTRQEIEGLQLALSKLRAERREKLKMVELMTKAMDMETPDVVMDPEFRPLLQHAYRFRPLDDFHCVTAPNPYTSHDRYGYVHTSALEDWKNYKEVVPKDILYVTEPVSGTMQVITADLVKGITLGEFKYSQSTFVVCTSGYFLNRCQKLISEDQVVYVLNDEVGRQFRWITAGIAHCTEHLFSAGDQKQLRPHHEYRNDQIPDKEWASRMTQSFLYDIECLASDREHLPSRSDLQWTILSATKRMHPILAYVASRAFYDGKMSSHVSTNRIRTGPATMGCGLLSPFVILDVAKPFALRPRPYTPSTFNVEEAQVAYTFAHELSLLERTIISIGDQYEQSSLSDFFALSPYTAQAHLMEGIVAKTASPLARAQSAEKVPMDQPGRFDVGRTYSLWNASTVARAQGLEKAYALVSLAKSAFKEGGAPQKYRGMVDENILTTAITRGMRGTVLIGDIAFHRTQEGGYGPINTMTDIAKNELNSYFVIDNLEDLHRQWDILYQHLGLQRVRPAIQF